MMKTFFVLIGISLSTQAFAWLYEGDLALTTSYRIDEMKTHIEAFSPPGTLVEKDRLKIDNINVWQIGAKGDALICSSWLIKGYAEYGFVCSGEYREKAAFPVLFDTSVKANVRNGHTENYSIAGGYLFSFLNCVKIGPLVGYSYDYEKVKIGKAKVNGTANSVLSGLHYDMRWEGPWIGVQAEFDVECIYLNCGYEYHWSQWRANWTLKGPDIPGVAFSDKRRADDAYGDVFYVDGTYALCDCWDIGLGLKYQFWKAKNGRERPRSGSFADKGLNEVDKVPRATWDAFQVQLSIGYNF